MSGRDDEDLFDVDDLRGVLGGVAGGVRGRPAAVGVALAVVAVAVVLALVPHVVGAVGADAVDTGSGPSPDPESADGARQRYQNYVTNLAFLFAPTFLPLVAVGVAFAGAVRARGTRRERVASVVAGAAVGVAVGYVAFVALGHLAYGEAAEGYIVETFPVTLRYGAIATTAVALAAVTAVGSVLAAVAGTVVEPDPGGRADRDAAASGERAVEDADGESEGDDAGRGSDAASDGGGDESGSEERPERVRGGERGDASGPASDYRETGPQRRGGSSTPRYDPEGRDWDGRGDDGG